MAALSEASWRERRHAGSRGARRRSAVLRPRGHTLSRAARRRRFLQLLVFLLRPGSVHGSARLNPIAAAAVWLALVAPSLFIVHKYSGTPGAAAYAAIAALAVAAAPRLPVPRSRRSRRTVSAATFAVVAIVFAVTYAAVNVHTSGVGSDDDDAYNAGARALIEGRYPY